MPEYMENGEAASAEGDVGTVDGAGAVTGVDAGTADSEETAAEVEGGKKVVAKAERGVAEEVASKVAGAVTVAFMVALGRIRVDSEAKVSATVNKDGFLVFRRSFRRGFLLLD
jgi:hypothetical protein